MSTSINIAILDDYANVALELADWSGLGTLTVFSDTITDEAALIARLAPFEVLCVMRERTPLPARIIEALPKLRLIVTSGARNLSIDLEACTRRGITVCGTGMRQNATSELTMALILALNRRLVPEANTLAAGGWQGPLGRDLAGLRLGLVGLGKVGKQMATLGRAFGMEVAAWSQNLTPARAAEAGVGHCDSLNALMASSDVISVHVVLSERSRGLIGAEAFASAAPGAALINTSRGPIVDTGAMLDWLRADSRAMAAVDVFDIEPLPAAHPILDHDLIAQGRLLLTPHLGYASAQTFRLFYSQMVEAVAAFARGAPIRVIGPA